MAAFVVVLGADRRTCSSRSPRASFPIRTPTRLRSITEAAQGTSYDQLVEYQNAGRRHHPAAIPNVEALVSTIGGSAAVDARRPEFRPDRRAPQAAQRAQASWSTTSSTKLRPKLAEVPGMRGVPAESADHPHRRPGQQEPVSVLDAVARQAGAVRHGAASCETALAERARARGRDERPRDHQPAGQRRHRPRQGRRARRQRRARSRTRSTTPTARAGSRRSTRRSTSTRCCSSSSRSTRPIRTRCRCSISKVDQPARSCRSTRSRTLHAGRRAADHQPLRPAAGGDHLVRPGAGRVARRRCSSACSEVGGTDAARHA